MFDIGDVIEPRDSQTPVRCGLYQIVEISESAVRLSRLHSNEDGKLALTGRMSSISVQELALFRRVQVTAEERP